MPLHKLSIEAADLDTGRALAQRLEELDGSAALAVTLFEAGAPRFLVEAYYDAAPPMQTVAEALAGLGGLGQPRLVPVPDENWVALSQTSLPPVAAGRLVVHGSHDRARFAMRRRSVEIEAGEAFGTGYNATTALCLHALDGLAKRRGFAFARVLDLGCGSGVLAIAAARLFHRPVLGRFQLFVMNPDGTGSVQLTGTPGLNLFGNWGEVRVRVAP